MIAFVLPGYEHIRENLHDAGIDLGDFNIKHYPNHEKYVEIHSDVNGQKCCVVGSISPPDTNLVEFSLMSHTLKVNGAANIVALLPYLAYARQDRISPGTSFALEWVGKLLASSGADEIVTLEVHNSRRAKDIIDPPFISISPAQCLADAVKGVIGPRTTIVSPDEGARARVKEFASAAKTKHYAHMEKARTNGIEHLKLVGEVTPNVVIYDDILDTGKTMISACKVLIEKGVENINIVVVHGLFTGTDWQQLWDLRVQNIYCLDTTVESLNVSGKRIKKVYSGPLLAKKISKGKYK